MLATFSVDCNTVQILLSEKFFPKKFDHILYCTSVLNSKKDQSAFKELSSKLDNLTILNRIITEEDLYPALVLGKRVSIFFCTLCVQSILSAICLQKY